jgi:DNA-binding NarL/FixJ family response regulator
MQIIIADDHKLVRDGVAPFLQALDSKVEVLEASTLDEALAQADKATDLGLVLLDLIMPGMNFFSGLDSMLTHCPSVPVVILSGYASRDHVITAMRHGASGFIPKTVSGPTMVSALKLILSGEKYLPSSSFLEGAFETSVMPHNMVQRENTELLQKLTAREREVLTLTVRGLTNKDIAANLGLKEITVKVHLRNVYRKIGANNRAQAVRFAMSSGIDGTARMV